MNIVTNIFKHFALVTKHRWLVFKLSVRAGIPWRGLLHDLSKYSPTEFFEGVKYYNGKRSPINVCREQTGHSKAWLHHKGRNKHHFEYWIDISKKDVVGVFLPYKYMVEAVCDKVAAGKTYEGKKWNEKEPYEYWMNIERNAPVQKHPGTIEFMDTVTKKIADDGINSAMNRKYLKKTYINIQNKYSNNV